MRKTRQKVKSLHIWKRQYAIKWYKTFYSGYYIRSFHLYLNYSGNMKCIST